MSSRLKRFLKPVARRWRRGERGQILIMFVGFFTVIAVAGALAVDVGFWLSERRGVSRASDLAALAAIQDLPESRSAALDTAMDFARRNGYEEGVEGVQIEVTFYCGNSIGNPPPGICQNPLAPFLSVCELESGCDAIEVKIRKPARGFFSTIFGVTHVDTGYLSLANVKFNLKPIDTVVALDATSSMGINAPSQFDCTPETSSGCPIQEAREAANAFVDILLDGTSTLTQVGLVPYRGCFNPPLNQSMCIRDSVISGVANVTALTTSANLLHTEINQAQANIGGSGTNICWALRRANQLLDLSTQTNPEQFVVLLTDGNHVYNSDVLASGSPPTASGDYGSCRPGNSSGDDSDLSAACNNTFQREGDLDDHAWDRVQDLEDDGVEIYVIGFAVCGTFPEVSVPGPNPPACLGPDSSLAQCPAVSEGTCNSSIGDEGGGSNHDNTADRRLLKCLASSEDGTNTHYFEVRDSEDLPGIFQVVAFEIASRGLTEGGN
jgi:hypothetical protein